MITGLVYMIMSINTSMALQSIRWPSTVLWCVGSFLCGLSVILIGLRQELDLFWSLIAAQTILTYSFLLRTRALQQDIAETSIGHFLINAVTLVHMAVMSTLLFSDLIYWLDVWVRTTSAIVTLGFTGYLFFYARTLNSRNAMAMASIYTLVTVAMIINMILTWFGQSSVIEHRGNIGTMLVGLTGILAAIFGHINYLGVVYEGSTREMALEMRKKDRTANIQNMNLTLTRLDRQIRMGALSTSLSHAISQPLGSMLIHLRQAQKWLASPHQERAEAKESLAKVVSETQRAADTIEEIREFLRPTRPTVEIFDAYDLLRNVKVLLQHEAAQMGGKLLLKTSQDEVKIYGDKLQLTHALVSIVQGILSSPHLPNGLTIDCDCQRVGEKFIIKIIHPGLSLTEKDLKMPRMIVAQFDGIISNDIGQFTVIELTAPQLPLPQ
jgi:C4-dicarboxylate-specific signal transduction histidine kinase